MLLDNMNDDNLSALFYKTIFLDKNEIIRKYVYAETHRRLKHKDLPILCFSKTGK